MNNENTNDTPPYDPQDLMMIAIDKYCWWLNEWVRHDAVIDHTYEPRQFTVFDPDNSLYGTSGVLAHAPVGTSSAFPRVMLWASVCDGDDGGPAELSCVFEEAKNSWRLIYMVQGFDTFLQELYNETSTYADDDASHWRNLPQ
jgi:hypothetical protein